MPGFEPGTEVARFRLPMLIAGMNRLVGYLEQSYGKGLVMRQQDDWMLILTPPAKASGDPVVYG